MVPAKPSGFEFTASDGALTGLRGRIFVTMRREDFGSEDGSWLR